jgi:hypothetical protein
LDGTRDGEVNSSRVSPETLASELNKIVANKVGQVRMGVWREIEEVAGVITGAERAGNRKDGQVSAGKVTPETGTQATRFDKAVAGTFDEIGTDLEEFGQDLVDGFYAREFRSSQSPDSTQGAQTTAPGRDVGPMPEDVTAPEQQPEMQAAGFMVLNHEVLRYNATARNLLVLLNQRPEMAEEARLVKEALGSVDEGSMKDCRNLYKFSLSAGQQQQINSATVNLEEVAHSIKLGERPDREAIQAATTRIRDMMNLARQAKDAAAGVRVSNPAQFIQNAAAPAPAMREGVRILVSNPARFVNNGAGSAVSQIPPTLRSAEAAAVSQFPSTLRSVEDAAVQVEGQSAALPPGAGKTVYVIAGAVVAITAGIALVYAATRDEEPQAMAE